MSDFNLHVNEHTSLKELKSQFQNWFPYLKLEFFRKPHGHSQGSPIKELLSDSLAVKDANPQYKEGDLKISRTMTVEALEDAFEDNFGLHVQVFRKSGKIWLETSVTDKWSLDRQNAHGAESDVPAE